MKLNRSLINSWKNKGCSSRLVTASHGWTPPRSPGAVYACKTHTVPVPVQRHTLNSEHVCARPGDLHMPGAPLGPDKMSPKLKFHQNWNVTKLKWHQNWNFPFPEKCSNMKRHKKFLKSLELDMTPLPLWKKNLNWNIFFSGMISFKGLYNCTLKFYSIEWHWLCCLFIIVYLHFWLL